MDDYLREFVQEADENITTLNNALLDLENNPDDRAAMDEVFRTAHTIKGNAGAMGFSDASDLAHAVEDLLDAMRSGGLDVTPELMDQVFEGVDELERLLDEVRQHGETRSDPAPVIRTLRERIGEAGAAGRADRITEPDEQSLDAALSAVDAPADPQRTVYVARLLVDGDPAENSAPVIEALEDAFELVGTNPDQDLVAAGNYDGVFDAVFQSAVGEVAIDAALDPVGEVQDAIIVDVTDRLEPAGGAGATGEGVPSLEEVGAGISSEEAEEMPVDDLLDEFTEYDDLDELEEQVEDVEGLEDLGEAGTFEDVALGEDPLADADATTEDAGGLDVSDLGEDLGPADDEAGAAGDAATTPEEGPDDAGGAQPDEEPDDATETFRQLKEEVDPVGFDELQQELDELEFEQYDQEDEIGFDELLGDAEVAPDEEAFSGEPVSDEALDDVLVEEDDDVAEEADADATAVADALKDVDVGEQSPEEPPTETDADDGATADSGIDVGGAESAEFEAVEEGIEDPFDDVEETPAEDVFEDVEETAAEDAFEDFDDTEADASAGFGIEGAEDAFEDFGEERAEGDTAPADFGEEGTAPEEAEALDDLGDDEGFADIDLEGETDVGDIDLEAGSEPDLDADLGFGESGGEAEGADAGTETASTDPTIEPGPRRPDIDGTPVDVVTGIGPTYRERLFDIGIETVSDLAGEEPEYVAGETAVPRRRAEKWVREARQRADVAGEAGEAAIQSVRVDVEDVDELLTLVEELVTSRVRLRRAIDAGEPYAVLDDELGDLEQVTAELQDTVMEVRLVPLENVVSRLPRTVRDIARDQDKEVDFSIDGEDVEIDRSVLNRINDPLMHVVRNAVDHGIEPPEERIAAGKDETGSVTLRARRERDRVVIEVEDDGRGLDPDRLREAAIEEDLLDREEAEAMDDDEAHDLIFHPGLSTTEEVTDVSGRGVGMDVVASTVSDLDGEIEVDSAPSEGTTIRMVLPVTVAISEMLFVQSGDEEFGIPIRAVEEIGHAGTIVSKNGREVLQQGEEEIELVRLSEALGTTSRARNGGGMVVQIRDDVRRCAIHCDAVSGQQEVVVKPFEGVLGGIPGLGGATVLGEGDVVNVLDVETL